jgi:hypothetical protein
MKVKGLTTQQLQDAINTINKENDYKIIFNRYPEQKGNWLHFTIRSEFSKIPGARTAVSGRNLVSASWHAHGYLFDEIFEINKDAIVWSNGQKITSDSGNWQDKCLSHWHGTMFSDLSILSGKETYMI